MADDRSPETRIARLESCIARLEERITADRDNREQWRAETLRRLDELNHHAARADAKDAMYLTKEIYEGRHTELGSKIEQNFRELTNQISAVALRFDARITDHDKEDVIRHREDGARIKMLEDYKTKEEAAADSRREATVRSRWIFGAIITVANLFLYLFLHFTIGIR